MADMFGKSTAYGNTSIATADLMVLTVPGSAGDKRGFLIQNITIQYAQPLQRLFEIGSSFVYFSPTRSQGTIQIGRIIGKGAITQILGPTGTGIWTSQNPDSTDRTIELATIAPAPKLKYIVTGAVADSYQFQTDANGLLLQEQVSIQFAGLELVENPSATAPVGNA